MTDYRTKNVDTRCVKKELEVSPVTNSIDSTYWRRWCSIWLTWFMMFLLILQFSMYSTTLAAYLPAIDDHASDSFAPWAISAFGFGQTVGCVLFGWMSNKMKNNLLPMVIGMAIMIIGNTGYCLVELFPSGRSWLIFVFRVITGFGGGIAGVIRAYCATAAKKEEYTKAVTGATAALALAIMVGPSVQAMFSPLGYPGFTIGALPIHIYNAPGWVSIFAAIACIILLYTLLLEEYPGIETANVQSRFSVMPNYDGLAAWTLIFCWFAIYLTLTSFVMIGKSYTMVMFHWSFNEAVIDNGIIMGVFATVSLIVFVIYAYHGKKFDERVLIFGGTAMMVLFWLITFPWPALPELADEAENTNEIASIQQNHVQKNISKVDDHIIDVGCNSLKYTWCAEGMTQEPIGLYLSTFFFLACGFPVANCALSALFSKVLGPRRQGTMQGVIIAGGAAARTSGPIFINFTFTWLGPRISWGLSAAILIISMIVALICYRRLVPLNVNPSLKSGEHFKYKTGIVCKF